MNRNNLNMEDLFRTQMDFYKVDPSPGLWKKVHTQILWKQFLSFSLQTFNVYYLVAAISLAAAGSYVLLSQPEEQVLKETINATPESTTDTPSVSSPENTGIAGKETIATRKKSPLRKNATDKKQAAVNSDRDAQESPDSRKLKQPSASQDSEKSLKQEANPMITDESGKKSKMAPVSVGFNASRLTGCSPLAIDFENTSKNAAQHVWIFGDGGSSADKDPSYVFDEPGEYPVMLKITGIDGLEYIAQQTIEVFESPKALFEMDDAVDLSSNHPVYFYNYSRGADSYEWDFGDEQRSNLAEPIHYYEQPGSYNVKLLVWTVNQCYDSLVIHNAFSSSEIEIKFPNAFTPNMTGSTGGFYVTNDISNTVFHPTITGELIEYQLIVYNRKGLQIFKSNDISLGWDGYYQEKLAAQAVYIWKVRGKFLNGKTFLKSGDVTLIRQF